jgi:hypothetical protein
LVLAVGLQRHGRDSPTSSSVPLVFAALLVAANGLAGLYRGDRRTPIRSFPVAHGRRARHGFRVRVRRVLPDPEAATCRVLLDAAVIAFDFVLLRKGLRATNALTARVLVIAQATGGRAGERDRRVRHGRPDRRFLSVPGRTFVPAAR